MDLHSIKSKVNGVLGCLDVLLHNVLDLRHLQGPRGRVREGAAFEGVDGPWISNGNIRGADRGSTIGLVVCLQQCSMLKTISDVMTGSRDSLLYSCVSSNSQSQGTGGHIAIQNHRASHCKITGITTGAGNQALSLILIMHHLSVKLRGGSSAKSGVPCLPQGKHSDAHNKITRCHKAQQRMNSWNDDVCQAWPWPHCQGSHMTSCPSSH